MAGQPVIAGNAPNPNNEMAMLLQGYSPQTAVAAQHSQYLAQALAAMREQGQNIRTPVALGSNLLAEALMQRKYGQSMQDFAQAARGDQGSINNAVFGDLKADAPGAPPAAAAAPAPDASVPPPPPPPTPQNTAPAPAQVAQFSPAVLRAIYGEDTHNPEDQRAIAGVILQRAAMSGMSPDQVVATGGFEGANNKWARGASDADLAKVATNVSGAQPGGFDAFYSPSGQAALGRPAPGWSGGKQGTDVGGNRFFSGVYAPPAGMDPARAQTPGGQPSYAPQGNPGPTQVSSSPQSTPTPSPSPSASGVPAPGGPAGAPPAAASPAAGGVSPQFLHAPVTDAEIAYAQKLAANPMTRQMGLQMGMELKRRQLAAIEPKVQIADGRAVSYDPYGRTPPTSTAIPGMQYGAPQDVAGVAGKFQQGPNGQLTKIGDAPYGAPGATPGVQGVTQVGPNGEVKVVGQPALPAERVLEMRHQFFDSDSYKKFSEGRAALTGFRGALAQNGFINNGVLDTAAIDSYLRGINPGMGARNATVQMFLQHLGLPQEIQGHILSLTGNGYLTPQTLQHMDQTMQAYVAAHGDEAQKLADSDASLAKGYGLDPKALGETYGEIPQPLTLNFNGRQSPAQAGASAAQTVHTAGASVANAAANLPRLSPEQAARLPAGTQFLTLDGRPRTAHGPRQ